MSSSCGIDQMCMCVAQVASSCTITVKRHQGPLHQLQHSWLVSCCLANTLAPAPPFIQALLLLVVQLLLLCAHLSASCICWMCAGLNPITALNWLNQKPRPHSTTSPRPLSAAAAQGQAQDSTGRHWRTYAHMAPNTKG
jgi:hypothetical protein